MNWSTYIDGLLACIALSCLIWLISLYKRDVSIVDAAWSHLFVIACLFYITEINLPTIAIFSLLLIWASRLSLHIILRSWGESEDRRYQEIRKKYSPGFPLKSLFIVFLFQAVLAWILTLPLFTIFHNKFEFGIISIIATSVVIFGICYESIADWKLLQFKKKNNNSEILCSGLWKYSRHPNYFGEALVWWGFYLFALEQGYWWSIVSPLLITYLLLKFSGITLLEASITNRRPKYRDYIYSTNAFFPGPNRKFKQVSNTVKNS